MPRPGPSLFRGWVAALALVLPALPASAQELTDPTLRVEEFVDGLAVITTMEFLGPDDALVLEKNTGRVRRVVGGVLQPAPVLDVAVNFEGERGLLGIAINTEAPPRVFLYYTEGEDPTGMGVDGGDVVGNRVYRYTWNPITEVLEDPLLILDLPSNPLHACHKGGILVLGPPPPPGPGLVGDGSVLYVIIGDLGLTTVGSGQLTNVPEGTPPDDRAVIFRVLQDGSPAAGNPFVPYCSDTTTQPCPGGTGCPMGETCITEVESYFAYGVRNSFGMTLDPVTGDLWQTENGPIAYDEVNRVEPGFNSGWEQLMGPDSRDPQGIGDLFDMPGGGSTYSDPEFSWFRAVAPTGILFPVGSALGSAYDDVALVGDNNHGQIYAFPLTPARDGFDFDAFPELQDLVADGDDGEERDLVLFGTGFSRVTDLKLGPDGFLYVTSVLQGTVYRIVPACPEQPAACKEPAVREKATVSIRDDSDDERDRVAWKWKKGVATLKSEFGDPLTDESYALCVYDSSGLRAAAGVGPGGTCGGKPCWRERSSGYRFKDRGGTSGAMRLVSLKAGGDSKSKISVRGEGPALQVPAPPSLASPLVVQLHTSSGAACWSAQYTFPPAITHTDEAFKDRAD